MCYCKPTLRTPWCPDCAPVMFEELTKLKQFRPRKLVYVAAPYSDTDEKVIQGRMELIYAFMNKLMDQGDHCITPLSMHELAIRFNLPATFDYWQEYCLNLLARCDEMQILCLPGWTQSRGIKGEIEFCKEHGINYVLVEEEKNA